MQGYEPMDPGISVTHSKEASVDVQEIMNIIDLSAIEVVSLRSQPATLPTELL
jgi:hypothetical protein